MMTRTVASRHTQTQVPGRREVTGPRPTCILTGSGVHAPPMNRRRHTFVSRQSFFLIALPSVVWSASAEIFPHPPTRRRRFHF
jgi:hypothetical protein